MLGPSADGLKARIDQALNSTDIRELLDTKSATRKRLFITLTVLTLPQLFAVNGRTLFSRSQELSRLANKVSRAVTSTAAGFTHSSS
jgi:hypothetical protein